jgi:hypothetical protein
MYLYKNFGAMGRTSSPNIDKAVCIFLHIKKCSSGNRFPWRDPRGASEKLGDCQSRLFSLARSPILFHFSVLKLFSSKRKDTTFCPPN